jgi:radical SAM superfamily enzyme YgiQ (UPF0313 family)
MSRIKILPVYPRFPVTFWGHQGALELLNKKSIMAPTGLATIAAMVPLDDFEVLKIADLNVRDLDDAQLRNSDIIFTSTMTIQEDSHNDVIDRAHFYGKKVVAGGPFPSSYPERNSKADYIISGEGEAVIKPFLEDLIKGVAKREYSETDMIAAGRHSVGLTKTGRVDITYTPIPRWDLVDMSNYLSAAVQFSRGCPFNCDFCDITKLYGREPRTKTPQQMIAEFEALRNAGHKGHLFLVDDNFIGNKENVRKLLLYLRAWQERNYFPFYLFTEASIDLAWQENRGLLEDMVQAGFCEVFVGIENTDADALRKMRKGQNLRMPLGESVRVMQNAGLAVMGGFIFGSDGSKPDTAEKMFDFIQENGIVVPMIGLLGAIKGTALYNRLQAEGRLIRDLKGDDTNTHNSSFNFKTELPEDFLIGRYTWLLESLFDDKNYYNRCRVLDRNRGNHKRPTRFTVKDASLAFVRSLREQLFSRGAIQYIKYLAETAVYRPRDFVHAVGNAIKLNHYKQMTQQYVEKQKQKKNFVVAASI